MLNGIINISAGSDFQNAAKPGRNQKYGKTNIYPIHDGHDSINISPAYNYLNKHKWKVKQLSVDDEKLAINFILQGIEFSTMIPLKQINQLTNIEYSVLMEKSGDGETNGIIVNFLVHLSKINHSETGHGANLSKLQTFFNRLFYLKMKGNIEATERKIIDGLLEGLAEGIQGEFDSINNGLFIFIEKYFNIKINGWSSKTQINSNVFVTKISSFTKDLL